MTRSCDLIASKTIQYGNNVSHSKRKTRRRFVPNLHNVTLRSNVLNSEFRLRVAASTLRTVDHNGGFDNFLLSTSNTKLTDEAIKIKRKVQKASAAA